jgi:hypothetical protein
MSHLNTDHTCDWPEIRKIFQLHYSTVNLSPSQQMCVYQQEALPSVCMLPNNVAVKLYRGNDSNVCDDCAILYDKNCKYDSSDVLKYLT